MRSILYTGALVLSVASSSVAQQPDSIAKRDSMQKADSAMRADSILLARELGRIRNEPGNRAPRAGATAADSGTPAVQPSRRLSRPRPRFEVALALPSLLVDDRNGIRVWSTIAPVLGVAGMWKLSPRLTSVVGIRGSLASVSVDAGADDWKAGRTSQLAVRAGLGHTFEAGLGVFVAGSGTWLSGPDDVTPFRDGAGWHWGGDAGVSWRVSRNRPLSLFAAIEGFMLGGATTSDPVPSPAWVRRFVVGVRHDR